MTTPPTLSILQCRRPEAMNRESSLQKRGGGGGGGTWGRGDRDMLLGSVQCADLSMNSMDTPKVLAM